MSVWGNIGTNTISDITGGLFSPTSNSESSEHSTSTGGSIGGGSSSNSAYSYGGSFGSGATASAYSHKMMQEANEYNAYQAELNRKWQEKMSNTAYQRAMKDLRKAGLNPILAYTNGGANVGTGATASSAMGTAYTDNYQESREEGHSSEYNRSWNNSESNAQSKTTQNIVNNLSATTGALADIVDNVIDTANNNMPQWMKPHFDYKLDNGKNVTVYFDASGDKTKYYIVDKNGNRKYIDVGK